MDIIDNTDLTDRAAPLVRDFGNDLRERRQALGLTLLDLSRLVGVNRRFIGDLENGKPTCEIGRAFLVATALGFSLPAYAAPPADARQDRDFDMPSL